MSWRSISRAGVHLLVEKPICSTTAQADELVEAARQRKVVLQVGHVERFNPAFNLAAWHTADPKYIETVRASGFTFRSTDVGVVLDLMIHDIDLVLSLVRCRVRKVDALGLSVLGGHEDVANARIEFESRMRGDALGVAGQLRARPANANLVGQSLCGHRFRRAFDHAGASQRNAAAKAIRRAVAFGGTGGVLQRTLAAEHLPKEQQEFAAVDMLGPAASGFRRQYPQTAPAASHRRGRPRRAWRWPSKSSPASTPTPGTRVATVGSDRWPCRSPGSSASTHPGTLPEQMPMRRREAG